MSLPSPEYLTHPNIPKPLHGINPRSVLGQAWWDEKRKEAYAKNYFCCWACGIHRSKAKHHQWLEGHESYLINYETGEVKLKEIIALCHSCHNFIHSGRLFIMYQNGKFDKDKCLDILEHGFSILNKAKLKPFFGTAMVWNEISEDGMPVEIPSDEGVFADWSKWHLNINGEKHYSKFKDLREWGNYNWDKA